MKEIVISIIEFYQKYLSFDRGLLMFLAPGGACKYQVSCSQYAKERIREFGVFRGSLMGMRRIISCR